MTTLRVSVTPFSNGCSFDPVETKATHNEKIKFKSVSGSTVAVYTYDSDMKPIKAFKEDGPPYNATTGGNEYKLADSVDGLTVILSLMPTGPSL
ncbi:MAG TPA: hypothetical protein VHT91_44590, partial [Kofleriaceae bacterium]|nr:hypothetical protein [Kofleriaceae bacterium]